MNYRFYITVGSSRVECFPQNFLKTSLVDQKEDGKAYYRRKFSGTLRFYCNTKIGTSDFDILYYTEELIISGVLSCQEIILEIEQKDSGANTYHNYWTGYFTTADGAWDLDNSTFDVTPKPYDNYKNFDFEGNTEYNIISDLAAEKITTIVTTDPGPYDDNIPIIKVIEYLAEQTFGAGTTVISWFLNNEVNYVTVDTNKYRYLTIAQKSDIKRPGATNPATIGMMSFAEMMDIMRVMYNVQWTYDGSDVRVEHVSYWDAVAGMDLRTQAMAVKSNKYSYQRGNMPRYEKFAFMEGGDGNYVNHTISYQVECVNNDEGSTKSEAVKVTTDLSYIIECMSSVGMEGNISDDGWVILANEYDSVDYHVYYGISYASFYASYNYVNSWSYLLRAFFLHDRVLMTGLIQGIAIDFISARKLKKQPVNAIVCYEDDYSPEDYITTELGETYFGGEKGYVESATIHPEGKVEFSLLYGPDKDTAVVMPPRSKNLHVVIDTSSYTEIISILSEPNIYDTYYWIFWNDGAVGEICQEIMIPAGTVYQEDLADLAEPFASIKFNFDDASLSGWTKIYNDNSPIVASDPGDCPAVPPVPPAPPAATTMIGASQTTDCAPVHVSWNASALATYYVLYRRPDFSLNNNWVVIDSTVNTYYDDTNQCDQAGYTFTYKVQACNIAGCSADSDETTWDVLCM
jgi:hypothetical protein